MEAYTSHLSDLFNGRQGAEAIFRKQSKQHYPATELAYIMRFIENLELIKTLRK